MFLNFINSNKKRITKLQLHINFRNYQKKVALVIKTLEGVFKFDTLQTSSSLSAISPRLQNICDGFAIQDEKDIALVKTEILLEQLSQQSLLSI